MNAAKKEILLIRAQEGIRHAYAENQTEFERLLSRLNEGQMSAIQRTLIKQQPVQQQQAKTEPDSES